MEFTAFSWALEINMLECQGIRVQNPACSRVKGAQHAGIYSIFLGTGADHVGIYSTFIDWGGQNDGIHSIFVGGVAQHAGISSIFMGIGDQNAGIFSIFMGTGVREETERRNMLWTYLEEVKERFPDLPCFGEFFAFFFRFKSLRELSREKHRFGRDVHLSYCVI